MNKDKLSEHEIDEHLRHIRESRKTELWQRLKKSSIFILSFAVGIVVFGLVKFVVASFAGETIGYAVAALSFFGYALLVGKFLDGWI